MLLLLQGIAQEGKEESEILTPEPAVPTALFSKLWFSQAKTKLVGSPGTLVGVGEKHIAGIS